MEVLFVYLGIGSVSASGWALRPLSRRTVRVVALTTVAVTVAGALTRPDPPGPWSNLSVLATSVALGVWIGRSVPPRFRPMATLLVTLALLDASQLFFAGGFGTGPADVWFHLTWTRADGSPARLGIADLVVAAAIGEHLRRRGAGPARTTLTPVGGFVLADAFVYVTGVGSLVLLPFLTAAWLIGEAPTVVGRHQSVQRRVRRDPRRR